MSHLSPALFALLAAAAGVAAHDGHTVPIYELPTSHLPDLHDGSLDDWEAVLPGPPLTLRDFGVGLYAEEGEHDPADLAVRLFLAWNSREQRLYVGIERVDDVYVNTYRGSDPADMYRHDGVWIMLDGDHSGGDYDWLDADDVGGEESAALLRGYQAQFYYVLPGSPDGLLLAPVTAAEWVVRAPWSDAGGAAWGRGPATSVMEVALTPWDALDWHGPEQSRRSRLEAGRIIGINVALPDWDHPEGEQRDTYSGYCSLSGGANTWRMAGNFADGLLIGCDGEDCGQLPEARTTVSPRSWGRIKATLR